MSIIKTLERIRESYSSSENDSKYQKNFGKSLLRKESKLPLSLEQFFSFVATQKAALGC